MTDFKSFGCKNVNRIIDNMRKQRKSNSVQLYKIYRSFMDDIIIILMLNTLCSVCVLMCFQAEVSVGFIHINYSLSESLWISTASKRWSCCEHLYVWNWRKVTFKTNFNYIKNGRVNFNSFKCGFKSLFQTVSQIKTIH